MDHLNIKEKKLTPVQGILGGVVIGVLVIVLLNQFAKRPITDKIKLMNEQIRQVEAQLKMNKALVRQLPALQKEHDVLLEKLDQVSQKLVSEETPVRWANAIVERHAAKEKLTVRSFNAGGVNQLSTTKKVKRKLVLSPNVYEEFRTETSLWGTYHQFGRFLANLETEFPVMRIATFSLRAKNDNPLDGLTISLSANYPRFSKEGFPVETRPRVDDKNTPPNDEQ